ncbi:response regulator transcription factor [Eggerthellaceae bacterium zg-1084]|uniref:Response regulator transcription factor n=1 Tax=Berryella wangjianweii TaxID=2734634 RepID=A0A6M8J5R9_9ACTN|nr:response regulator transcription factor [Berryella wangjianweii]NPD31260.1 response regulator transcription factor [Berryella wangjianweii]NPD32431.1 response regulator transcription factor [Eggerthellaceae bacterium zg-997]QKF06809.1 response regulator transcription factor [Berryella wangjianweii]
MQVLIAEDDVRLARALTQILKDNGYDVDTVHDGRDGLSYAQSGQYDVVILDLMLPHMNGYDVVRELRRAQVSTPVLMLTARGDVRDKIAGLDAGADDYMTKPFAPAELLAHLRALTRRVGTVVFETIEVGDLTLNLEDRSLSCGQHSINLSFKEFELARVLMSGKGRIIEKDTLISKVWGTDSSAMDNNVEAYVSFLRKKMRFLGSTVVIEAVRKVGYRMREGEGSCSTD